MLQEKNWNVSKVIDKLKEFPQLSRKKRRKIITKLITDDEFMKFLFKPDMSGNAKNLVLEQVAKLYECMIKASVIVAILDMVEKEGVSEMTQTQATFFNSLTSMAIEDSNEILRQLDLLKTKKEISRAEAEKKADAVSEYTRYVAKLMKVTNKIVAKKVDRMHSIVGLPKVYGNIFLINNPEPKYIDKYKIGFYLNNTLSLIYQEADDNGIPIYIEEGDWHSIFEVVYGKENIAECATFILLEGAGRLSKYTRHKETVKDIWDSLTAFALDELNRSPDRIRDQMLGLYVKRIDKMFQNGVRELRVNLTGIDQLLYPKLMDTVKKFLPKLEEILKR